MGDIREGRGVKIITGLKTAHATGVLKKMNSTFIDLKIDQSLCLILLLFLI